MDSNSFLKLAYFEKYEDNIFLYDYKSESKGGTFTYAALLSAVKKCLNIFEQINLKQRVGIAVDMGEHSAASCALLLGILNYDCHFCCLDFEATSDISQQILKAQVTYFITANYNNKRSFHGETIGYIEIFHEKYLVASVASRSEKNSSLSGIFCYTITTSGSTGVPKVLHVPFQCIEPNIQSLCSIMKITAKDIIFLGSPPSFDPFLVEFFIALRQGASILIASRFSHLLSDSRYLTHVTILQTTPSIFRLLGAEVIRNSVLHPKSSLRCLLLGGECFPSKQEIQTWLPENYSFQAKRIFNLYGITEVSCWSTIYEYDHQNKNIGDLIPLGKPLDDSIILRVGDTEFKEDGNNTNSRGELLIGSATRRCFMPSCDTEFNTENTNQVIYRNTGDIVEISSNGNIFYIGRTNSCIKRLGKKLCLDSLADKVGSILNSICVCLWHSEFNKVIFCIYENECKTDKKHDLMVLKNHLSDFEKPDAVHYIDTLPLNRHGKVDRKTLLQDVLLRGENKKPLKIFQNFLKNVLGIKENISPMEPALKRFKSDITFTEAGGTSFQALSLATEIGKELEHQEEQRTFLDMLLSSKVQIMDIFEFLAHALPKVGKPNHSLVSNDILTNSSISRTKCIQVMWRSNLKKCVDASPTLFDNTYISIGSHSNLLLTLNAISGKEISRIKLPDRIECPVVFVSHNLAIVGCYDGILYGFNFQNGSILWQLNVNGMIKAKPLVVGNLLIVSSYAVDFNIQAYSLETLKFVWSFKLGSKGIFSSPLLVAENVGLFCGLDGTYALLQITSGTVLWLQKLDSPIFSSPALITNNEGNEFILAEVNGQIHVCNAVNGEEVSHFKANGNIFSGMRVKGEISEDKHIIFGCHDGNVYCLSYAPSTKQLVLSWKCQLNAAVFSTPNLILDDDIFVVACSTKGLIVLINFSTSAIETICDIQAEIFSTPCILQKKLIYVGARDNFLYALEIKK